MMLPIVSSPFAEMMPTWAISFLPLVAFDCSFRCSTTASTALSMPRLQIHRVVARGHQLQALFVDRARSTARSWTRSVERMIRRSENRFSKTGRPVWSKDVARRRVDHAADGRPCDWLARAIYEEGLKLVARATTRWNLKRGIDRRRGSRRST